MHLRRIDHDSRTFWRSHVLDVSPHEVLCQTACERTKVESCQALALVLTQALALALNLALAAALGSEETLRNSREWGSCQLSLGGPVLGLQGSPGILKCREGVPQTPGGHPPYIFGAACDS